MSLHKKRAFIIFSGLAFFLNAHCAQARQSELHLRTGYFTAKYSGAIENEVSVPGTFDIEYSTFISNSTALTFRSMAVIEFPSVKNYFSYSGAGLRFFTQNMAFPVATDENGFGFRSSPTWRTYLGADIGLAQATIVSYGKVLQTNSSLIMVHFNAGAIYTLSPQMGISGQLNLGVGSGYSAVSVMAMDAMALLGVCFFF